MKNKIQVKKIVTDTITALLLMVFAVSFAIILILNFTPIYKMSVEIFNIPEKTGYAYEEIVENYNVLIEYNRIFGEEFLELPSFPMSETGRIHFEEVKNIFLVIQYTCLLMIPVLVGMIIYKIRSRQFAVFKISGIITIMFPLILSLLCVLNWQWFFRTFHEILFNNDYWIFDYKTDPVIRILPEEFFFLAAVMVFVLIVLFALFMLFIYRHLNLRERN